MTVQKARSNSEEKKPSIHRIQRHQIEKTERQIKQNKPGEITLNEQTSLFDWDDQPATEIKFAKGQRIHRKTRIQNKNRGTGRELRILSMNIFCLVI